MPRPSAPLLSRRSIAETALAIIDEEGAHALTLRRIADRLEVRPSSLYNHVSSREEILDMVTELINSGLDHDGLSDPDWRRGLMTFARSYRRAYAAHPRAAPLVAGREVRTEGSAVGYELLLARLTEAGWPDATAIRIILVIDHLSLGSAITPFRGLLDMPAELAARHPRLTGALAAVDPQAVDEEAFELAIGVFLAALEPPV